MEWQQLVGFHAVAKHGSFTRAAEVTFRTQSALSQQVKRLEEELDCKLFDRFGKQGFNLTVAGRSLFGFAESVLLREKQFLEELDEIKGSTAGSITMAAPLGVIHFFLAEPLCEYKVLHPKVDVCLKQSSPQACIDLVQSGEIDFCVTHGSTIPPCLKGIPWKRGEYVVMVPKGHELTKEKQVSLEMLTSYPLILPQKDAKFTARLKIDEKFNELGLSYRASLETTNILLNADFVSRGMGISFVLSYDPIKELYGDVIDFIPMDHIFEPERISFAMRKDRWFTPAKLEFLDFILSF